MKTIKVKINGIETEAEDRTPILNIAQKLGIKIPTLCHHPLLEPYGVCRICTVEVRSGKRIRMVTACNYPATNGIEILTEFGPGPARPEADPRMDDGAVRPRQSHRRPGGGIRHHGTPVRPRRRRLHPVRTVRARLLGRRRRQRARVLQPRRHARSLDRIRRDLGQVHRLRVLRLCLPDRRDQDRKRRGAGARSPPARPADPDPHPLHAGRAAPAGDRSGILHSLQDRRMQGLRKGLRSQSDRPRAAGPCRRRSKSAPSSWRPDSSSSIATQIPEYGYGKYKNVMTGLEFEKMNSASGPTGGQILMSERPGAEERRHHPLRRKPGRAPQQVLLPRLLHVRAEIRAPDQGKDRGGCLQLLHRHALLREGLRGVLPPAARGRSPLHPRPRGIDHRFPVQ